ncbi:DinB superfamily protein [Salegentibacter holothuriorum]|uniref:DinB superfamily protein n=1 Tax=Salegentibacter holothuriorum TaxID=241145 RepID=A0A1T5CRD2_9FLAO|nr:DinB family protein [Salegentibacter holothuriorum]SKB61906.1 DinB superfamily protein [Salegentibacter holothuriorum]
MALKDQKEQLLKHLKGGEAFASLESFINEIPFEKLGERPHQLPYSFYELFYHVVFAQKDIIEYAISGDYKAANWPDDYWPKESAPNTSEDWEKLKKDYVDDRNVLENFLLDPKNDLNIPVRNSEHHTLLREVLLVIEHTAYHTGQMLIVVRLLGLYK